jgi:CRP-like cAMP-binding protein
MSFLYLFEHDPAARDFAAGEVIFREGDAANEMYVVVAGEVAIGSANVPLETVGPGGILGELSLVDGGRRSGSATARSAARLVPVDEKRFAFLVQQTPFFALQVMRILAARLRRQTPRA